MYGEYRSRRCKIAQVRQHRILSKLPIPFPVMFPFPIALPVAIPVPLTSTATKDRVMWWWWRGLIIVVWRGWIV